MKCCALLSNIAILLTVLLSSCRALPWHTGRLRGPARELPAADLQASFPAGQTAVPKPTQWWRELGSTELDTLIDEAFTANLSLGGAWARLRQAWAQAKIARSARHLQLDADASAATGKRRYRNQTGHLETDAFNAFGAGLTLAYEVDVWGRIQASSEASLLRAEASQHDLHATALMLSGEVASTWITLKANAAELAVLNRQLRTARQYLDLLRQRQLKAMSAAVDVLQQQQQVASLTNQKPPLQETVGALQLQLGYLLGRSPGQQPKLAADKLPELPPMPDLGLPAHLLEQRPDVRAAAVRLRAQELEVAVARADRLPALRLSSSAELSAEDIADLVDSWALNLLAGLAAPFVDGGRRRAEVDRNLALADERFLNYRQAVLQACLEVNETALREAWKRRYLEGLEAELALAGETLEETRRRYLKGVTDYLPVLTALTAKQRVERSVVRAKADLLRNRVNLYRALGGGWMHALEPMAVAPREHAPAAADRSQ